MLFDRPTMKELIRLHGDGVIGAVWKTITNAAVAAFTAVAAPVRAMVIDVTPVQSGSGDPSPENVRPISGWTGANIWVQPTHDTTANPTASVSWQSAAGTVYGGTLDVTTGLLTVTHASVTLTDDNCVLTSSGIYLQIPQKNLPYPSAIPDHITGIMCDRLKPATGPTHQNYACGLTAVYGHIRFYGELDTAYASIADFISAVGYPTAIYPLDPVLTYQLTPTEVTTLRGQNNVWADTGNINTLTYRER